MATTLKKYSWAAYEVLRGCGLILLPSATTIDRDEDMELMPAVTPVPVATRFGSSRVTVVGSASFPGSFLASVSVKRWTCFFCSSESYAGNRFWTSNSDRSTRKFIIFSIGQENHRGFFVFTLSEPWNLRLPCVVQCWHSYLLTVRLAWTLMGYLDKIVFRFIEVAKLHVSKTDSYISYWKVTW